MTPKAKRAKPAVRWVKREHDVGWNAFVHGCDVAVKGDKKYPRMWWIDVWDMGVRGNGTLSHCLEASVTQAKACALELAALVAKYANRRGAN